VDFVAGNFNEQFTGTRYPRVYLDQHLGSGTGTVEWDDGGDILVDGDPPINRSTGATDVLEAWDVYLENTQNYNITFTTSGADLKLFLFPPDVLWAGRSNNVLQLSGSPTPQTFSPGLAGWYGVVVVNDNGVTGSYSLGFGSTMVGVEDEGRVTVTELRRIAPNPARGEARFLFALRDPGVVSFQIIDVTGRVVAGVPPRQWDTGRWSLAWDGHGTRGDRIASGVYFVRMMVGNQLIARRKLVLLQ